MNRVIFLLPLCLCLSLSAESTDVQEMMKSGKCMQCHNEDDFTNPYSKIKNKKDLFTIVDACQRNNNVMWFEDDVSFVADHLNKHYYKSFLLYLQIFHHFLLLQLNLGILDHE